MMSNEVDRYLNPKTENEWEVALTMLESWRWDGKSITDISERLNLLEMSDNLYSFSKTWAHTVPSECRNQVFYVESSNPINSEEQTRRYAEILAVDECGNALVSKTNYNSYTDDESTERVFMPISEAKALIQGYKQRWADAWDSALSEAMRQFPSSAGLDDVRAVSENPAPTRPRCR